ncbi:hypothetical protein M409DRAFT_29137 [Zasmidium cellare ATCC 36951]|uniref:Uncharacterized protein n=1 Tax=Zasmidium cellare ATCC 36951 TaxID=1080233 RepID=A0A6A6C0D6_ZASCE|nr:uncharacterized protein M409DRAFT_29137 [Zasmidium cellare ATCC 36951]KAF2160517.1 hypothetical protein M409DRAFT_29137 [Zasmidium cellare ATCC 36951]
MSVAKIDLPSTINTRLNYYLDLDQGGTSVTSCEEDFTLDRNGFQLVQHESREKSFDDDARVKDLVYRETVGLLKDVTGASLVAPFSHIIRRQSYKESIEAAKKAKEMDIIRSMNPAIFCHVDQSYNGALQVLEDNMSPPEAERWKRSRWGIINVWRPIERAVLREPLAVCDARTVDEADLRPVMAFLPQKGAGTFDQVSKGKGFEIWNLAKNEDHKWYYASRMIPEEVLLIKCFDSKNDRARLSPHTAFQCEFDEGPPRQSIEHVSDVEDRMLRNVSDLEDRIDKLDPSQLTPAASENTTLNTYDSYAPPTFQQSGDEWPYTLSTAPVQDPWSAWYSYSNDWATPNPPAATDNVATEPTSGPANPSHSQFENSSPGSEGVAFRDREIAQLDELMRKAQESIQNSDTVISEKDGQIQQLASERDYSNEKIEELERVIFHRENTIRKCRETFEEQNNQLELLQDNCESKDAAIYGYSSRYYTLQQAFLDKKTQLCHADRQVQQLQHALHDMRTSMADEIAELRNIKDEEIGKLRDFCEAREAVVQQQEQIIARGASLLEDRDAELEKLGQQMKGLDDDYRNETRERARFARLLDERDEEIGQLKTSLSNALTPHSRQGKREADKTPSAVDRDEKVLYHPSPFATAATPGRRTTSNTGQWTPKAIDNYTPLPHEQRRASVWKTGLQPAEQHHKFGVPGKLASPSPSEERTPPENKSRDLRRSDSLKLLERLALAEEGGSRPARSHHHHTGSKRVTKRSRLPLDNDDDDIASRPPLPARVPPRKMLSVNELGSRAKNDGETGHQRPISRHQSIQEFPRHNRLQAYVEDGASGGDV